MFLSSWKRRKASKTRSSKKHRAAAHRRGPAPLRLSFESLDRRIMLSSLPLDTSFGSGGVTATLPIPAATTTAVETVQSDGKIIIGGGPGSGNSGVLARFNSDGTLDTSFGINGLVATGIRYFSAVAVQPDGDILLSSANEVTRYQGDGSLDTSFGDGGHVYLPYIWANTLASGPNGEVIAAGFGPAYDGGIGVTLLNADGSLDSSFGTDGTVLYDPNPLYPLGDNYDTVATLLVEADNSIMVGGSLDNDFGIQLYHFSGTGTLLNTTNIPLGYGGMSELTDLAIDPNGDVIAAGWEATGAANETQFVIARANSNGVLDPTFGSGGIITTPFNTNYQGVQILTADSDKLAVIGTLNQSVQGSPPLVVADYASNGALIGSWGVGLDFSLAPTWASVTADGDILTVTPTMQVVRFLGAPQSAGLSNVNVVVPAPASRIDLSSAFIDPTVPSSDLTYSISDDTNPALFSSASIDAAAGTLDVVYSGSTGSTTVTIRATAPDGQFVDVPFDVAAYSGQPSFEVGSDVTISENTSTTNVPIEFAGWATNMTAAPGNPNPSAFTFQLTAVSGTSGLFAPGAVSIDSQGDLFVSPTLYTSGKVTFSALMQDNGGTAGGRSDTTLTAQTFTVNVNFVNHAPQFTAGGNQTVDEDSGTATVSGWATNIAAGPANESSQTVNFNVTTDSSQLFAEQPSISANGTLTFLPAQYASGTATVTVTLQDNGGTANGGQDTSAAQTFTITILPVNQQPYFVVSSLGIGWYLNGGPMSIGVVGDISAGAPNESNQILTFSTTNSDPALFSVQPTITPDGMLNFTPAPGAIGEAGLTITLTDNGGTANGGHDSYTVSNFTITILGRLTDIPALSSLPGAAATLYLNFGGDTVSSWGNESPGVIPAYDQDHDPTTFNDTDLASIKEIWTQVANAYSPFNINVTTIKPASMAHGQTMEVDIGGTGAWDSSQPEGGVAYVGGFTNASLPNLAFVFSGNLGDGDPTNTADAIEHEAGHMLGLEHQSTYSGTTLVDEYNPGTAAAGPIMGVPYGSATARWWDGPSDVSSTTI
ncbi:MAG TPA: Ig-like domain-containing protein, partial [Pirellulales bacterium]|nr:Ig-like domain-containing protein [Pirellulales bacterium]